MKETLKAFQAASVKRCIFIKTRESWIARMNYNSRRGRGGGLKRIKSAIIWRPRLDFRSKLKFLGWSRATEQRMEDPSFLIILVIINLEGSLNDKHVSLNLPAVVFTHICCNRSKKYWKHSFVGQVAYAEKHLRPTFLLPLMTHPVSSDVGVGLTCGDGNSFDITCLTACLQVGKMITTHSGGLPTNYCNAPHLVWAGSLFFSIIIISQS